MNEDQILGEIRKLTLNDELPIDKLLKKIMSVASSFLSKNDERSSYNKDIAMGNILSFLKSKGITHVFDKDSKYELLDTRVNVYPYNSLILYALYSGINGWSCYLGSSAYTLQVRDLDIESAVRNIDGFDIKHGMLFSVHGKPTSKLSKTVIIVPNRKLIQFRHDQLYVSIGSTIEISLFEGNMKTLPQHVIDWIYPPVKRELPL